MAEKNSRLSLTVKEKHEICDFSSKWPSKSQQEVADHFANMWQKAIKRRTVGDILQSKEKWMAMNLPDSGLSTKKFRPAKYKVMERALFLWFKSAQAKGCPTTTNILRNKAAELGSQLNVVDFSYSNGWLKRFKQRYGISYRTDRNRKREVVDQGVFPTWTEKSSPIMPSPKRTDQETESDKESKQDSDAGATVKIKEEPADTGYEKTTATPGQSDSNSNSRTSSPCPPVHFGSASPAQGRDSPSQSASSGSQNPLNDVYSGSSIRSQLQGASAGKKTDTVQNIVEGLLKKNATLLAMSDTESLRPQRRYNKGQDLSNGKKEQSFPTVTSSSKFPISSTSQARLVQSQGRKPSDGNKTMLLRPKSPTRKCDSLLRDRSLLSYSLMESDVGDESIEKIFKVQNHELVCAVSSKPFIFDKVNNEKRVVASLDNNYFWCNFCSFSSSNKSLITNHIMEHRFNCKYCTYESFCRSDILRHSSKMHEEFEEMSNNLSYCTFLSDYVRIKSRADGKENNGACDQDKDVGEVDLETMKSFHAANLKRKLEVEEKQESAPNEKWSKMESSEEPAANGQKPDRPGKSRKSQNPRRHPQVNEKDYDTFEMEVEEIDETENSHETHSERILYPSSSENSNDLKNPSNQVGSHMQVIPSLQEEGVHGFTATHVSRPTPPQPPARFGRPPTFMANSNRATSRGTHRSASASSLYWSCGYCDFQSSSQAEIKEHSNRTHPGKPHRLRLNASPVTGDKSMSHKSSAPDDGHAKFDADEVLPKSTRRKRSASADVKVNELDKRVSENIGLVHKETENPYDIYAENAEHNSYNGQQLAVNIVSTDISGKDGMDDGEVSDLKAKEKFNCEKRDPGTSASSLKLTFRTVGDHTVCSMGEKSKSGHYDESDGSGDDLEELEMSFDNMKHLKQVEELDPSSNSSSEASNPFRRGSPPASLSPVIDEVRSKTNDTETMNNNCAKKAKLTHSKHIESQNFAESIKSFGSVAEDQKVQFDFVPARSAAVKAMNKMKPVVDDEGEDTDDKDFDDSNDEGDSLKPKGLEGGKHDNNTEESCTVPLAAKKGIYTCSYCSDFVASPLRTAKSHLVNQHPKLLPVVINVNIKPRSKMKNTFYVCPFSSCNKLFSGYEALMSHRSTHSSASTTSKPKERTTVNSRESSNPRPVTSCSAVSPRVPSEGENIPYCRVLLHPLGKAKLEALQSTNRSDYKEEERYECLYCTEYFSHTTLSGMKQHYAAEHPDQLLVIRDVEAKKEKLASRIYACEEMECSFTSLSRTELDSHAKCHKSNCTYVYECAGCGWYSSSFWSAKDHLKSEHSTDDNVYLIHMQLSVDENGHTSKKVLRSV